MNLPPRGLPEHEGLDHADFIIIVPIFLPKIVAIDLRKSSVSWPHVTTFSLKEIISDGLIARVGENLRKAREENLISVVGAVGKYSSTDNLAALIARDISDRLNAKRPDAALIQTGLLTAFSGHVDGFLKRPEWVEIRNVVEKRAGGEVLQELQQAIEQMQAEEKEVYPKMKASFWEGFLAGEGNEVLWQRPSEN